MTDQTTLADLKEQSERVKAASERIYRKACFIQAKPPDPEEEDC